VRCAGDDSGVEGGCCQLFAALLFARDHFCRYIRVVYGLADWLSMKVNQGKIKNCLQYRNINPDM
jgi:hypothetical protein